MAEKYKNCQHSTGRAYQTLVEVYPGCPRMYMIAGTMYSDKEKCKECRSWRRRKENGKINTVGR